MARENLSLYFTIKDDGSSTLTSLADKTRALDKETQSLAQAATALNAANKPLIQRQTELRTAMEQSAAALKEAKKEYQQYGDAIHQQNLSEAISDHERLKRELQDTESQIKANTKTFNTYRDELRKGSLDMTAGGGALSGGTGTSSTMGIGQVLGALGVGDMASDLAKEAAGALITSALGEQAGSVVGGALSGAISGAALGTAIAPGIGTAIGAAVGGLSGLISGGIETFQKEDEAFKEYYQSQYETVQEDQSSRVERGSTLAGSREQTQLAFEKRFSSAEAAADYLSEIQTFAANTNYSFDEIVGYAKSLLNTYNPDEVFGVLTSLSDATAGLSLSSSDVSTLISGLSRMRTTGKATAEYLNFFSERGIDTYQALANATGADKSDIAEMVKDGEIGGAEAAEAILTYINDTFGGLSDRLTSTYDAMVDNLSDAEAMLDARAGEGYNEERKKGIAAQSEWLDEQGEEMGDAYSMIGRWKASLENLAEQYEREAIDSVMEGSVDEDSLFADSSQRERLEELAQEYQEALADYESGNEEAGATMGRILAEAQAIAMNEYNASEGYQLELQSQLELAGKIRNDAALDKAYWDAGYRKGEEFSKGMAAAVDAGRSALDIVGGSSNYHNSGNTRPSGSGRSGYHHAFGLERVPYDDYPALLHEGERVLTASEARSQDGGGGPGGGPTYQITVTGNSFSGVGDDMAEQVAEVIVRRLEQAATAAAPA